MSLTKEQLAALCQKIIPIAYEAGDIIEEQVKKGVKVLRKMDGSPVTAADQLAEDRILECLSKLDSGFKIVGEELVAASEEPDLDPDETYWIVDALDGTKEFIKGTGEYTVNIGLIENQKPVLGVVYAPAIDRLYYGYADEAFLSEGKEAAEAISTREIPEEGVTVAASRSHGDTDKLAAYLKDTPVNGTINSGSSLKFCIIAEGRADLYPRFGPTCEWDTAAAHAVLNAAGGAVIRADDGSVLAYGKIEGRFYNPEFIAHSGALYKKQ